MGIISTLPRRTVRTEDRDTYDLQRELADIIRSRVNLAIEDVQAEFDDLNGHDEVFRNDILERVRFYINANTTAGQVLGAVAKQINARF